MKTRIIKTEIYFEDDWFNTLLIEYKFLFLYLFTNSHIGLSGIYQLSDRVILLETGLTEKQLNNAKVIFEGSKKVFFKEGWIYIVNAAKHNNFTGEVKKTTQFTPNIIALNKELLLIPRSIFIHFTLKSKIPYQYPIDTSNNHNTENIKHYSEFSKQNSESLINIKERVVKREKVNDDSKEEIEKVFKNPVDQKWKLKSIQAERVFPSQAGFIDIKYLILIGLSVFFLLLPIKTHNLALKVVIAKENINPVALIPNIKEKPQEQLAKPVIEDKPLSVKEKTIEVFRKEFGEQHVSSFEGLMVGESHFNPYAVNPTSGACGIFQAYPCQKLLNVCGTLDNVDCQIEWGKKYILARYGNPTNAYKFWLRQSPHWY